MVSYFHSTHLVFTALLLLGFSACSPPASKPETDSQEYKKAVSDFYISLAAIQSDQALFAVDKMKQVAETFPAEPAAWANLGVFAMRQGNFELATERMDKALDRAPDNARIQFLAGILESRKGDIEAALSHLRKSAEIDSTNPKVLFALADELERQDPRANAKQINNLLDTILEQDSDNLAVLLETVRIASKMGDRDALQKSLSDLERQSAAWPRQVREQFGELKNTILEKSGENITFELAFLQNNLNQLPSYQHDLQKVQLPPSQVGFLVTEFLWLPNEKNTAAPADEGLAFQPENPEKQEEDQRLYKPVGFADEQVASSIGISGNTAVINATHRIPFPGEDSRNPLPVHAVATVDYDYDFLNDLAFAGKEGFRLYRLEDDSTFTNVTDSLGLGSEVTGGAYYGVWARDTDLDGDLDLALSPISGPLKILRNNGDGTFDIQKLFPETENVREFLWADFDMDGDADAVLLTENGRLLYYRNERSGRFEFVPDFNPGEGVVAADFGDMDGDGFFEIVSWRGDRILSTGFVDSTAGWYTEPLLRLKKTTATNPPAGRIFLADLDNNGALDLLVSSERGTRYWLSNQQLELNTEAGQTNSLVYGLGDMNGDTRLDLVGLSSEARSSILLNTGTKAYQARIIRPRASGTLGDQRINSFGIGGEIESRSGRQYLKQPITGSWVHFGLGTYQEAEMLRIIWPNGSVQAEFAELGYDTKIMNEQMLKGSCPWVFTYNGKKMEFVTDFLWRTALGLRINAQGSAKVIHSIDWIKIDADQLKPRNGFYDVRITADLWETHFFDHVALMAVDRPKDTRVFVDERFVLPAPEQKLYAMRNVQPVVAAFDRSGREVTAQIRRNDRQYVKDLPQTAYQGLTEEHFIEVDLGDNGDGKTRRWLIASGWIYPTDSSINVAISQGDHKAPHGIRVEVPDGKGGWKVARENIGFPAGKNKTILIDLEGLFEPGAAHHVRLYTNMEIYWDQFQLGYQDPDARVKTRKLSAQTSRLRYRGYSKLEKKERFSPTVPDYQQVSGTTPKWRDLVGFYTRFGEVTALTDKIDDRYVIMNAGDELVFRFPEIKAPPKGWVRDFVLIGDGWVKDGDYNTGFSKTVLPLPYHGMEDYTAEPGVLQEDPVYRKHRRDWVRYHTRFVTPQNFNMALQFKDQDL